MKQLLFTTCLLVFIVAILSGENSLAQNSNLIWQIGTKDSSSKDLTLGDTGFANYNKEGFFIVGASNAKQDWPYIQPGPNDAWAGNKEHTFTIYFGLNKPTAADNCALNLHIAGVGNSYVQLAVSVNKHAHPVTLLQGNAQSIYGKMDSVAGKTYTVNIPGSELINGNNVINITSKSGSWFVYDAVDLTATSNLQAASVNKSVMLDTIEVLPFVMLQQNKQMQPGNIKLVNLGKPEQVAVRINGLPAIEQTVNTGTHQLDIMLPAVTKDSAIKVSLKENDGKETTTAVVLKPVERMTIYILPHSHNDIGYTEIQTKVEEKQVNNLIKGIAYSNKTKNYPKGARFVWNLEGTYAANLYLQRMDEAHKKLFFDAVKDGGVALNGMYVNTLTGLCQPEELKNLFKYSVDLAKQCGVQLKSAMISDVPGYTWGTVAAMAQAGIKYFSVAPNYFDRIGDILVQWENKPFYWLSPSGKEKVLVWIPYKGYALSHTIPGLSEAFVASYLDKLKEDKFPYDITYVRWSGHGDNAVPDTTISDFVKSWNSKYEWPKFIISSTNEAFSAFESKYGDKLPVEQGDWTGYWEDGAGSSAFETAENRHSSSALSQAETMWAITNANAFPKDVFERAWRNVILYSEHTWGADVSITKPLSQKTKEQWTIKKSYADSAANLTASLINKAADAAGNAQNNAVDVFNTSSWQRSDLVMLSQGQSSAGDVVKDETGNIIRSQRLSSGKLAFIADSVQPFSSKRFFISKGKAFSGQKTIAGNNGLDNGNVSVEVDAVTGAIKSLRHHSIQNNFTDSASAGYLDDYLFLEGKDTGKLQRNGKVSITIKDNGPVLATLHEESNAPGANMFSRDITLVNGSDYVQVMNVVNKKPAMLNPKPGDYAWANTQGKESLNFGFPFHVQDGVMKVGTSMAVVEPEKDQIPGSCKNWMETNSWVDVSNKDYGITWATLDAPLIEVGGITANLLGGQTNPAVWRKHIEPTQKLYSWALNNHWETNYRAYQDGALTFRYIMQPHKQYNAVDATKLSAAFMHPFIVTKAHGDKPVSSLLKLSSHNIIALALKPADNNNAFVLTLFNPSSSKQVTSLHWSTPVHNIYISNTAEEKLQPVHGDITIDPMDVITILIER